MLRNNDELENIVNLGQDIQNNIDSVIMLLNHKLEVDEEKDPVIIEYTKVLYKHSLNSIDNLEDMLDMIQHYEGELSTSHIDRDMLDYLIGTELNSTTKMKIETYITSLEMMREYIEEIIGRINDERSKVFLHNRYVN